MRKFTQDLMLLLVVIITNLKQLYQDVFRTPDYF